MDSKTSSQIERTIKSPISFFEIDTKFCKLPENKTNFDNIWHSAFKKLLIARDELVEDIENSKSGSINKLQDRINEIDTISKNPQIWAQICWSVIKQHRIDSKKINEETILLENRELPIELNSPLNNPENLSSVVNTNILQPPEINHDAKIPNGCCENNDCSLNLYYKLIVEELSKE
jgi:hypothetical protein